jgi:8-oxo-dGTP pyrophosphatase MutT (NUDIX family)
MTTVCDRFLGGTIEIPTNTLLFRPSAYGLVFAGERILLLRYKGDPKWTLPGGAVEKGETIETALRREIQEETGLSARVDHFLHVTERFFFFDPASEAWQAYLFYYRCTPSRPPQSSGFEVPGNSPAEPWWVNIRDLKPNDFQTDGQWLVQYLAFYLAELTTPAEAGNQPSSRSS